jgi:hypothetical protein
MNLFGTVIIGTASEGARRPTVKPKTLPSTLSSRWSEPSGREPADTRRTGESVDIGSRRGSLRLRPLAGSHAASRCHLSSARSMPSKRGARQLFVYVVDNITEAQAGLPQPQVLEFSGPAVRAMVGWPSTRDRVYVPMHNLPTPIFAAMIIVARSLWSDLASGRQSRTERGFHLAGGRGGNGTATSEAS